MPFTIAERLKLSTKVLAAGVIDGFEDSQWYETRFSNVFKLLSSDVFGTDPVTGFGYVLANPAANLTAARAAAAAGPAVIQDWTSGNQPYAGTAVFGGVGVGTAVRLTPVVGTDDGNGFSTFAAYQIYNDAGSSILNNWIKPQSVPQPGTGNPSIGYAVSLYNGDPNAGGTLVTQSAGQGGSPAEVGWIFNADIGLLFLAEDFRASVPDPYIVGFRYVGDTLATLTSSPKQIIDADLDTFVRVEQTPDDDTIRMQVGDNTGNFNTITNVSVSTAAIALTASSGLVPAANGGAINLRAGDGGQGGNLDIRAGNALPASNGFGGFITVRAGDGDGTGGGGSMVFTAGESGAGYVGPPSGIIITSSASSPAPTGALSFSSNSGPFPRPVVGFRAPNVVPLDTIWTLPAGDGTVGQVLTTDGLGILSWASAAANNRVFADALTVAAVVVTAPTLAEIQTFVTAGTITDTLVYYTSTNTNTDPITHVYWVDAAGVVTVIQEPASVVPGIDDVLAVGQLLTAPRTLNANNQILEITNADGVSSLTRARFEPDRSSIRAFDTVAGTDNIVEVIDDRVTLFSINGLATSQIDLSGSTISVTTTTGMRLENQTPLLFEDSGTNTVGFVAPLTITTPVTWTLPAADGAAGTVLSTNGAGTLSWLGGSSQLIDADLDTRITVENTPDSDSILAFLGDNSASYSTVFPVLSLENNGALFRTPNVIVDALGSGGVSIQSGTATVGTAPRTTGSVALSTGTSFHTSGDVNLTTGDGEFTGAIALTTGLGSTSSGGISLTTTGTALASTSGNIDLNVGTATNAGSISVTVQDSTGIGSAGGGISFAAGGAVQPGSQGGTIQFVAGQGATTGGQLTFQSGNGVTLEVGSQGGPMTFTGGSGHTTGGNITITSGTAFGPTGTNGAILIEGGLSRNSDSQDITIRGGASERLRGGDIRLESGVTNSLNDPTPAVETAVIIAPRAANGVTRTGVLSFEDTTFTNHVNFRAPAVITTSVIWTLPGADGVPGSVLSTDGAGILSWQAGGSAFQIIDTDLDTFVTVENAPDNDAVMMFVGSNGADYNVIGLPVVEVSAPLGFVVQTPSNITDVNTGQILLRTGATTVVAGVSSSGDITLETGASTASAGTVIISGGVGQASSGSVSINGGGNANPTGQAGSVSVFGGNSDATASTGGNVDLAGGNSTVFNGGTITLRSGSGNTSNTGVATDSRIQIAPNSTNGLPVTGILSFIDTSNTPANSVGFRAPAVVTTPAIWTLPPADGTVGSLLTTDGAGILSWTPPGAVNQIIDLDLDTYVRVESSPDVDTIEMGVGDNTGNYSTASPIVSMSAVGGIIINTPTSLGLASTSNVSISSGSSATSGTGSASLRTGDANNDSGTLTLTTGDATLGNSGNVIIGAGNAAVLGGNISLTAGAGTNGGDIRLTSGNSNTGFGSESRIIIGNQTTDSVVRSGILGFQQQAGANFVGFRAPAAIPSTLTWTLPGSDGAAGEVLSTDGAGVLTWAAPSVGVKNVIDSKAIPGLYNGLTTLTTSGANDSVAFVRSTGGNVSYTGTSLVQPSTIVGATVTLIGCSDTDTVTLAHSADMLLNGNITLQQNTVLQLMWDGFSWLETSRNS